MRYYYQLVLTGLRVIRTEGWRSFWVIFREWLLQNARGTFKRLWWWGTGQFSRAGNALLPHYYRFVPGRVKEMVPHRVREAVRRQLSASRFRPPRRVDIRPAAAVARASHGAFTGVCQSYECPRL